MFVVTASVGLGPGEGERRSNPHGDYSFRSASNDCVDPRGEVPIRQIDGRPEAVRLCNVFHASFFLAMNTDCPPAAAKPGPLSPRTSGLAVASLLLGISGMLIVPAVFGFVCAIIALIQIRPSQGVLRGTAIATTGLVLSVVFLVVGMIAIPAALLLPALAKAKARVPVIISLNNVKQLNLGVMLYADDSKDRFPTATQWCDLVKPYVGGTQVFLRSGDQKTGVRSSYAYNDRLVGSKLRRVNKDTVMVFELEHPGWNVAGGPELLRKPGRFGDTVIVGFADGRAESIPPNRLKSLRWDP